MAFITIRLLKSTRDLLRRAATDQICDQNEILEKAVEAFAARTRIIGKRLPGDSPFPPPDSDPDSLIFQARRYRRYLGNDSKKFTTTVSNNTMDLINQLAEHTASIGEVVDRSIRFYLWDQQRHIREGFMEFIYPAIHVGNLKSFLEL